MKKLILVIIALLLLPTSVMAASSRDDFNKSVLVLPDEVIDGDFINAGERVDIYGTVLGDVYVAGGTVNIEGNVEGDVIAAGGTVTISGNVGQDVRAAGGTVTISGNVSKNITVAGGTVEISRSATVNRNVYVGAGSFFLAGSVNGDLTYATDPDYVISETASVSGTVNRIENDYEYSVDRQEVQNVAKGFNIAGKFISMLSTLLLGYLLIRFLPRYASRASELITTSFWKSLLIGFASFIVLPISILVLFISIIGWPIAVILLGLMISYGFISRIYAMVAIGQKVSGWTGSKLTGEYWVFVVGVLVYYLLSFIPIIGGLITFAVVTAGFGAALRNIRNTYFIAKGKKIL